VSLDEGLQVALAALQPYLADVVLAGGWVPHVYSEVLAPTEPGGLLATRDVDLAVPRKVPTRGQTIDQLLGAAGFECEFRSLETPPATAYFARRDQPDEVEIEFVTPARGSRESTQMVQDGLSAQAMRYAALLLDHAWEIPLPEITDGALSGALRVPAPAAFVMHKCLTYRRRRDALKREKDLYYAFFVVSAFPEWHERMKRDLVTIVSSVPAAWVKEVLADIGAAFSDAGARGAVAVAHQRPRGAFPGLVGEQFNQYAVTVMADWLAMSKAARSGR
jgi:hypothetical protein